MSPPAVHPFAESAAFPAAELLRDVLDGSLSGLGLCLPVYDPVDELIDFRFAYLNPAAQRLLRLPADHTGSCLREFSGSQRNDILAGYRATFLLGGPGIFETSYPTSDGHDQYFQVAARRSGAGLLLSFTPSTQPLANPRQHAEQLHRLLMESPAALCIAGGPDLVLELVNPRFQEMFSGRALLGHPVLTALPELAGHAAYLNLRLVFETGAASQALGILLPVARPTDGVLENRYFNYTLQARYDGHGQIDGVLVLAFEVTPQVDAGQRADALQAELLASAQRRADERAVLYQVFEETPALICILRGPEHRYEYFNAAYQHQFAGRSLLGRAVAEALPEAAAQGFVALLDRVYQTGDTFFGQDLSLTIDQPDQAPTRPDYYNLTYQAYRENGHTVGVCVFAYVVTPQVLARQHNEALQAQVLVAAQRQVQERETFYQVFAETPAAISIQRGPEHRYEYLNAAYQGLFPGRPLLGLPVAVALPELVPAGIVALLDGVYRTGDTFFGLEVPLTIARVGGQPARAAFFTFTYQAYRENGVVVGITTFAHDVTEQVLTRQAREVEREQLRSLFMQAPAGICILAGPELVFEFINPSYYKLLPGRALEGRPVLEALPELADSPVAALLRGVYASGQTHKAEGLLIALARAADGVLEDRYFSFVYQARRDEYGQVDGIVVFVFEVTEQALARQTVEASARQALALANELRESNEQLTRTNVDLDTFIYTASHDLKAPISNIEGLLFTLQCELPAPSLTGQVPHILDLMQDAVERFKKTIGHLTAASRLQKEYDQPNDEVALAPVIEDVRLDLIPLLLQTNGQLDVDVRDVPTVTFSEKNLRSVVYNLLSNAFKYRHPDRAPLVRLRARLEPAYVVLEVQDNGLGLTLGPDTYLFAMFQRFHTHVEGSGVGLYMVKRMVENAGGKIEVQSELDKGSTFSVYLKR